MITLHKGLGMAGLAVVNAVYFTSPLFASLGAIVLLRERVRSRRIAALIIGFVGTLIIIRPGFEGFSPGALWVVVAAMFWAWVVILTRILGRTESSVTIVAYMTLFLTPMALGPALTVWVTPTTTEFGWLALVGACQIGTQMCHAQALKLAEATAVMPLDFGRLIWASLLGYLLFAEVPDVWTWIGGTVIFASSIHIAYREAWNREAGAARPTGRGDKD